jgi:hypothetical protein
MTNLVLNIRIIKCGIVNWIYTLLRNDGQGTPVKLGSKDFFCIRVHQKPERFQAALLVDILEVTCHCLQVLRDVAERATDSNGEAILRHETHCGALVFVSPDLVWYGSTID